MLKQGCILRFWVGMNEETPVSWAGTKLIHCRLFLIHYVVVQPMTLVSRGIAIHLGSRLWKCQP